MKKYELTEEKITINVNQTLYRIKALRDFGSVKAGDLGGFVESEKNLSHDGDCWICDGAKVYEDAKVFGSAIIFNFAIISGSVSVCGYAKVFGSARIF